MYKKTQGIYEKQDVKTILAELEDWRVNHNLTRAQLAKRIGLHSYITTYYWYKCSSKPYPRHLWRIIQLLGKKLTIEEYKQWKKERIK
jgi:transcriptional regulator with XRE-family HTH domain